MMTEEAIALKGQLCSVVFVSGCLVLVPFAVVMEGSQVKHAFFVCVFVCGLLAVVVVVVECSQNKRVFC